MRSVDARTHADILGLGDVAGRSLVTTECSDSSTGSSTPLVLIEFNPNQ